MLTPSVSSGSGRLEQRLHAVQHLLPRRRVAPVACLAHQHVQQRRAVVRTHAAAQLAQRVDGGAVRAQRRHVQRRATVRVHQVEVRAHRVQQTDRAAEGRRGRGGDVRRVRIARQARRHAGRGGVILRERCRAAAIAHAAAAIANAAAAADAAAVAGCRHRAAVGRRI